MEEQKEEQSFSAPTKGNFYAVVGKAAGWISAAAFVMAFINKLADKEWLFSPSDLLQAALYLVLFAIFSSMAAIGQR